MGAGNIHWGIDEASDIGGLLDSWREQYRYVVSAKAPEEEPEFEDHVLANTSDLGVLIASAAFVIWREKDDRVRCLGCMGLELLKKGATRIRLLMQYDDPRERSPRSRIRTAW
jgi:hypothetical protein